MSWGYLREAPEYFPFTAFHELHNELSRLFEDDTYARESGYPKISVWQDAEKAVAITALPGVERSKVEVTVNGNLLTISGEREAAKLTDAAVTHRRERRHGKFSRSLELPFAIDSNGVIAEFKDGVLSLTLPRIPEQKPRKIQVN